ncbi:AAA family ATPase [Acetobacterium paludosum]|uniref:AAA family ATPase n=1 Tax=Acetobacterium paludosum TaxID=52693 RepID=A0A923I566_9FIRM|nr:ATP-binding protein [Acetobacterium paludosum]MBC3889215.1 AAA family ATPase [Acetobacterium paludosum]
MVQRKQYIEKLKKMKDKEIIKVITGIRRCGKSTLLMMFRSYLKECGVANKQIISINFEDIAYEHLLDYRKLHDYVLNLIIPGEMTYIFLDEVQNVPQFQKAVDSLFIKNDVDLYITGSNAQMLSGELATLLSGRYIEINMLPLSFSEYYEMVGGDKRDAWSNYFINGGFPYSATIEEDDIRRDYLTGIYNTVLLKDVVARKRISDIPLLESVVKFLFDNIGNIVSSKKIADSLTSYGRKTTSATVENYIEALTSAFILYKASRYDIKGKQHLKSLEKYYLVDIGLRRMLLGDKNADIGHILENIVYLELIRRGYSVNIGKVDDKEIDFIAMIGGDKIYYQVSASILDPATFEREIAPLKKVPDNYPKFILSMDNFPMDDEGIKQINIIDFLLEEI